MKTALTVKFPKRLRAAFLRTAKKVFPYETFAVLVGKYDKGVLDVRGLVFPPTRATPEWVSFDENVYRDVQKEVAEPKGLRVLGDLHSHCYPAKWGIFDAAPSEGDLLGNDTAPALVKVQGICAISECPSGRRLSKFRFWPRVVPPLMTE